MNATHLYGMIEKALSCYEPPLTKTDGGKAFAMTQVRYAAEQLLSLACVIRGSIIPSDPDDQLKHNIRRELLKVGQAYSSMLFSAGLRDAITDPIENFYGIAFNSLKILPQYREKATGEKVYLAFYDKYSPNVTLLWNGGYVNPTRADFERDYALVV